MNPSDCLKFINYLCDSARSTTLQYFRSSLDVESKGDGSPVSIADRQTESNLRQLILENYPEHSITGEEYGKAGDSQWHWVIDPIDGTLSYLSGFPIYAVLVALMYAETPIACAIDMPKLNERFTASYDSNSQLNGKNIHTSLVSSLAHAKLYSTDPNMFDLQQLQKRERLACQTAIKRYCGDGYLYGMLAAGWIDLVVEADLKPHDFLPVALIVERAGGIITDWNGNLLTPESNGEILAAANTTLHQKALAYLQN